MYSLLGYILLLFGGFCLSWGGLIVRSFETDDALSLGYVVFLMLINGVAFSILMGCYLKMYCAIRGSQVYNISNNSI